MRWSGNVKSREKTEMHTYFWLGNLNEREQFKKLAEDESVILK
jgi:hypothetical protein